MSPILDSRKIRQKLVVVLLSPWIEMEKNLPAFSLVVNPMKTICPNLEKRKKNTLVAKYFSFKCGVFADLSRQFIGMLGSLKTKVCKPHFPWVEFIYWAGSSEGLTVLKSKGKICFCLDREYTDTHIQSHQGHTALKPTKQNGGRVKRGISLESIHSHK